MPRVVGHGATRAALRGPWEWRRWDAWLTLAAAVGAALLFQDFGIGWDSEAQAVYGEWVLDYFMSGFRDRRAVTDGSLLPYYGTLFELPSAALHRLIGVDKHTYRALLTALCGAATIPAVAGIARMMGSERSAFWAALSLLLMPQFFGHAFINSKDIPLALAVAWAMLTFSRMAGANRIGWKLTLAAAVSCGAVLAVRVGAVFIFVFLAAALGGRFLRHRAAASTKARASLALPASAGLKLLVGAIVTWGVTILLWPFAHQNPLLNPYLALRGATDFPQTYYVLFAGAVLESTNLPAHYLPAYLTLTLSLPLLVFLALGTASAIGELSKRTSAGWIPTLLVLLWVSFPVLFVMVARPNIYDGMRHFLFILPGMAILAGGGVEVLTRFVERRVGPLVTGVFIATALGSAVVPLLQYHPYQYSYLNALAGERSTLHERYEVDYWVTSYRAAAEWLSERQDESADSLRVLAAVNDHSFPALVRYLDRRTLWAPVADDLDTTRFPAHADYYVGTVRRATHRAFGDAPVVWEERRGGVLLSLIRGNPSKH